MIRKQHIDIWWWNMGGKQKEFSGDISDCLKAKGIKVSKVNHPQQKDVSGLKFTMNIGSASIVFTSYSSNQNLDALYAIQMFLVYMGDRTQIKSEHRTININ